MGKAMKVSPFAPGELVRVPAIPGVRFATAEAGIRYKNRTDLLLAVFDEGTVAAGVTTTSKTCSAPVLWCREQLWHGRARGLVVNSGNANAFTGKKGREAVAITVEEAGEAIGCPMEEVYVASTGVIGEPLDAGKFAHLLGKLAKSAKGDAWESAARAIMTTDTYPKLAMRKVKLGGATATIAGFCKGAGMIAPDMATMLCFLFTDAPVRQPALQRMVAAAADRTFNCITIDGDTSTSDTVLAFATARAAERGAKPIADLADPDGVRSGAGSGDARAGTVGRQGRRGAEQVRHRGGVRGRKCQCSKAHRVLDCEFTHPEDGDRGLGPELGPRGDGGRQVRRGGGS